MPSCGGRRPPSTSSPSAPLCRRRHPRTGLVDSAEGHFWLWEVPESDYFLVAASSAGREKWNRRLRRSSRSHSLHLSWCQERWCFSNDVVRQGSVAAVVVLVDDLETNSSSFEVDGAVVEAVAELWTSKSTAESFCRKDAGTRRERLWSKSRGPGQELLRNKNLEILWNK